MLPQSLRSVGRSIALSPFAIAMLTTGQSQSPERQLKGVTFQIKSRSTFTSGTRGEVVTEWTGNVQYASGRGRMDIVSGTLRGFEPGDYNLFDEVDGIVVHPRDSTFSQPTNPAVLASQSRGLTGVTMQMHDPTVTVDTLGDGGVIAGVQTQHVRLRIAYSAIVAGSVVDSGDLSRTVPVEIATDYWLADVNGFPTNTLPTLTPVKPADSGEISALSRKLAAARESATAGRKTLKAVTISKSGRPGGAETVTSVTTEVLHFEKADIEVSRLVLPAGFRLKMSGANPQADATGSMDPGAKWRKPPQ